MYLETQTPYVYLCTKQVKRAHFVYGARRQIYIIDNNSCFVYERAAETGAGQPF